MDIVNNAEPQDKNIQAAIIIIGDEITAGRTRDGNAVWIAARLVEQGIAVREIRIVGDDNADIVQAVRDLSQKVDYVFTTGGIGPTHDDITAQSVAQAFGRALIRNEQAYAALCEFYGQSDLLPSRAKMSMVPQGSALIDNPVSVAPGFCLENVYVMAGIPRIMQAMMENVLKDLPNGSAYCYHTIDCYVSESEMAEIFEEAERKFEGLSIGSYPHFNAQDIHAESKSRPNLSIVLRSKCKESVEAGAAYLLTQIDPDKIKAQKSG